MSRRPSFNDAHITRHALQDAREYPGEDAREESPTEHATRRDSDVPSSSDSDTCSSPANDTVDEGDDDDEDDEDPFWGNEAPDVAIRAPSTADTCSVMYTNFKHHLDDFLSSRYESYFFAPAIVTPRHRSDIAALVILLNDQDDEELPSPEDLSRIVGNEFVFVMGKGLFEGSVSSEQSLATRMYHLNIMAGDSIEVKDQKIGTAGIFVKSKDKIIGITPS